MAAGKLVKKIARVVKTTRKLKTKKAEMGPRDIAGTGKKTNLVKKNLQVLVKMKRYRKKKGSAARMMKVVMHQEIKVDFQN